MEERRRFARHEVAAVPLRATLVLSGGSLLQEAQSSTVEINARPINVSQGGVCLSLGFDATWDTLKRSVHLDLYLENGEDRRYCRGRVVRIQPQERLLGLEFEKPLPQMFSLIQPFSSNP